MELGENYDYESDELYIFYIDTMSLSCVWANIKYLYVLYHDRQYIHVQKQQQWPILGIEL